MVPGMCGWLLGAGTNGLASWARREGASLQAWPAVPQDAPGSREGMVSAKTLTAPWQGGGVVRGGRRT